MSSISQQILAYGATAENQIFTKAELVQEFGSKYFRNAGHYIQTALAGLVKRQNIMRISRGKYKYMNSRKNKKVTKVENQPKLF